MGGLITRLVTKHHEYRILIQGLDCSGKTTLLYRLKLGEVVTTIPTIGFNVETIRFKNISLTTWDLGGRDKTRALHRHYYANTHALIFMIDSKDKERLDQAKDEFQQIINEDELQECPILVLANKQDLDDVMTWEEIGKELEFEKVRQKKAIFPITAVKGEGIADAIEWLISQLGHTGFKTGLTQPVTDTLNDVIDSANQSKTSVMAYFKYPMERIKSWISWS